MSEGSFGRAQMDAAQAMANAALAALRTADGVHAPTLVAGAARLAGTFAFRSFALPLDGVAPGQAVLSAPASEASERLTRIAASVLGRLGVAIGDGPPAADVLARHAPSRAFLDTQRALEPLAAPIVAQHALTSAQAADAAAVATALLVRHVAKALTPDVAFAVAALGFVEGCRTAPDPVHAPPAS